MNRKQARELLPAIQHFAKGENLWAYDGKRWFKQTSIYLTHGYKTSNIIEDRHFEARKHFALGGKIQVLDADGEWSDIVTETCVFCKDCEYRPKPKEPVYEWQWWYFIPDLNRFQLSIDFYTEEEDKSRIPSTSWTKFEPSKRVRK